MAQIEKRGEQRYRITVYLGRIDGKRKYKRELVRGSRKEALSRKRDLEEDLQSGILLHQGVCTLNAYLDNWLDVIQQRLAARTHYDYTYLLKHYIRPKLGRLMLSEIEPLHIQEVYTSLKHLAPRTIKYVNSVLRMALKQAVKWRMLKWDPTDGVELPKQKRKILIRPLTEDQIPALVEAARGARYGAIFLLALTSGLRPEEYLALTWSCVDLETGTVRVKRALVWQRKGKAWSFDEPKTPKAKRTVPIPSQTVSALRGHKLKAGTKTDLVFSTPKGGPIDPDNLNTRHFKPLLTAAKLPTSIRLYDLRHTWVTLALAGGVSPKTVSEWAGHASVAFTLDTYAHLIPSMEQAGAEQLKTVFSGILSPSKAGVTQRGTRRKG